MKFDLDHSLEVLERTPRTLSTLLEGLSTEWLSRDEGPDTFSPRDVVGHLLHGEETDWVPRIQIILEEGTARTFTPFDRFGFREKYQGQPLSALLDRFAEHRERNLAYVKSLNLDASSLSKEGRHPDLGRVTLRQLLATWTVHDLAHLRQVARVMAKQYGEEVGPWERYFRVLQE
ncbi:MAG TPA: DinB family protein [Vicinamibacteria bacterium]|nr:DinB family protein [Vicinamibacteria bacterium]